MAPDELIVTIHARADALFVPHRGDRSARLAGLAIAERRETFHAQGLAWSTRGGTPSDRQAAARALAELKRQGLVEATGMTHVRVRLTERGHDRAAGLAVTFTLHESRPLLQHIAAVCDATADDWCPESFLFATGAGRYPTSPQLVGLENQALPLLTAGWITSNADGCGHVAFFLTPTGREVLAGEPPRATDLPEPDAAAIKLYDATFRNELAARETWRPEKTNAVTIGLGAGSWPALTPRIKALAKRYRPQWPDADLRTA